VRPTRPIQEPIMCRNIKTLFNFEPPATDEEIHASAIQFVRKLSGFNKPSKNNEAAFDLAVEQVRAAAALLIRSLVTNAPARDRETERIRLMEASRKRFGNSPLRPTTRDSADPAQAG
jgi:hypothetical protein